VNGGGFSRPFQGLTVCGDSFLLEVGPDFVVAAVVDGLGHGYESSVAAVKAVEVIKRSLEQPVGEIVLRCHRELKETRGAAIGVLKVMSDGQGQFCGVGNIEVQLGNQLSRSQVHDTRLARSAAAVAPVAAIAAAAGVAAIATVGAPNADSSCSIS